MTTGLAVLILVITLFILLIITVANNFDLKHGNKELTSRVIELQLELNAYKLELAKHNDQSLLANGKILKEKT
jgi:hypothetical protein